MLPLYYFSICQFIILVLINNILFWSILLSFFATFIVTILLFVLNFRLCYFYICLHAFTTSICLGQGWQHNKGGHDNKGLRILHTLHVHSPPPIYYKYSTVINGGVTMVVNSTSYPSYQQTCCWAP